MKKINVLHLLASNSFSGAENVACTIIKNSKNNSYYCSPDGAIKHILEDKRIKYIPLKRLSIIELKKIVKTYNIEIIHAHDFKASILASFLKNNVKIISHIHCNYKLLRCKALVSLAYSLRQQKFSKIFVVSDEILKTASFGNKISKKTKILHNVLDETAIIDRAKEKCSIKSDVIFVGRLIDIKQPLYFIDIISELKKQNPKIRACIIGDGELYNECKEKIKEKKLENNINMLGFLKNPYPYIKNSKLLILPSKYEGLPMTVIEALILDTPTLNSGVGGLNEVYSKFQKYICHNINEYITRARQILNDNKGTYINECKSIRLNYTDIKKYIKTIDDVYDEISKNGEKND